MDLKTIQTLEMQWHAAAVSLLKATEEMWPRGTAVRVMLSSVQKTPSAGTVVGHWGSKLSVRLDTLNRRGYNTVKHVHWQNISS